MKKRLFIAIPLSDEVKEELIKVQRKFKKINLRWTKKENLHITLVFIGWVGEEKVEAIKKSIQNATRDFFSFLLRLDKIVLGLDEKRARMIWAVGEASFELKRLKEAVANELKRNNIFFEDGRPLKLHITLARARGKELQGLKIDEKIDLVFPVKEIYLMESKLEPEGAIYKVLALYNLKK